MLDMENDEKSAERVCDNYDFIWLDCSSLG